MSEFWSVFGMKVCFVTNGTVGGFWQQNQTGLEKPDVVVFGFNGLGLVSYKKELIGDTEYFGDVAKLSKGLSCTVISGCDTDTYGVFKHSAVVADKGRILGVSDMTHSVDESEFAPGGNLRVYDTSAGKIGVLILEDLFFPETSRVLALCDADFIVCIFKRISDFMPQIMVRSSAFSNGVCTSLCAKNYALVSDIKGKITLASAKDVVFADIKIEKDYRLISSRQRGFYKDFRSGY